MRRAICDYFLNNYDCRVLKYWRSLYWCFAGPRIELRADLLSTEDWEGGLRARVSFNLVNRSYPSLVRIRIGVQKYFKKSTNHFKILGARRRHEASSILGAHKYWAPHYKL